MGLRIRELKPGDNVARLSLGEAEFAPLKAFLKKDAKTYHQHNITKTFVVVEDDLIDVYGYVSLRCSQIELARKPEDIIKYPYSDYPSVKIVRLAVDRKYKGSGVGTQLVQLAVSITKNLVMPNVGCRFMVVDSKSSAIKFYEKCGFTLLDTEENREQEHPLLFLDLHKL